MGLPRVVLVACVFAGCGRIAFDNTALDDGATIDAAPLTVTRLQIYDPSNNAPLQDITNGGVFNLTGRPNGIGVLVDVAGSPGSVEFKRNESIRIEGTAPFVSGGNAGSNYKPDAALVVGGNELSVTAFALPDRGGAQGPTKTINLVLELPLTQTPAVLGAGIINDNNTGFVAIAQGGMYSASNLPTTADIRVETEPAFLGSVTIGGSGPWGSDIENYAPYTAMGSGSSFTPTPGTYTLVARAWTLGNGRGEPGPEYTVTFQIVP